MKLKKLRGFLIELANIFKKNKANDHEQIMMYFYNKSFQYEGKNYDPYFIREIMDLYGGMGSFFDIGYGSEFYNLKNSLYEECVNLRTKKQPKPPEENKDQEDEKE